MLLSSSKLSVCMLALMHTTVFLSFEVCCTTSQGA
jgi:hypothetical protein